jgi:hypothetical protein
MSPGFNPGGGRGEVRVSSLIRSAMRRLTRSSPNILFWILAVFGLLAILFAAILVIPSLE